MSRNHLITIVQKPANESQIESMIAYYRPSHLTLLIQSDSGRIDLESILQWQCIKNYAGQLEHENIDFFNVTSKNLRTLLKQKKPFTHIALPLYVGLPYWLNVRWLKQFSTVINLADGSTENTTIKDCFLRIKVKKTNFYHRLKSILLPVIIRRFFKADICFFPFSPTYQSCFAKQSLAVNPISLDQNKKALISKIIKENDPEYLFIGGYEYTPEYLAGLYKTDKFIATSKEKVIIINGEKKPIDLFICAEDVLSVFKPKAVVGCASDAVLSAKLLYPDIPCYALESTGATNSWGTLYNQIYKKQTQNADVIFVTKSELSEIKL